MALTNAQLQEILSEAGVDGAHMRAAATAILECHGLSLEAIKEERDTAIKERDEARKERDAYKAEADKLPGVQKELDALKAADWRGKYETLKADTEAAAANAAKKAALDELLNATFTASGVEKIQKYGDFSAVELTKDGKVKGADKLLEGLKAEWGDFVKTTTTTGADIANPPVTAAPSASGDGMTSDDIYKIEDATERQKAINEHPALFGYSSP